MLSRNSLAVAIAADLSIVGFPLLSEVILCAPARAAFSAASVASARAATILPPSKARPAQATKVIERMTTKPDIEPRSQRVDPLMELSTHRSLR